MQKSPHIVLVESAHEQFGQISRKRVAEDATTTASMAGYIDGYRRCATDFLGWLCEKEYSSEADALATTFGTLDNLPMVKKENEND
jgi:hypothetical protein